MYKLGELVQYGNNGVCKVSEIANGVAGLDQNTTYYVLTPISKANSMYYLPVDSTKAKIRPVLSKKEMQKIFSNIENVNECEIVNEKQCELVYSEAMLSLDCEKWLELLKTLCIRKQQRALSGKKVTNTDEKYFKNVSGRLTEELRVSFGEEYATDEINRVIEAFENCAVL